MPTVLSVQSWVACGNVGNTAALFALQRLGCETWSLNTVAFSNHTGYERWRGDTVPASTIAALFEGIAELGVLPRCDAVLSGYLGEAETGPVLLDIVERVKEANPRALFCCDPVMGDVGLGYYVRSGIPEFFRDRALALPPLNTTLAQRMMEQTKIFTALKGVRGRKAVDMAALEALLVRFSQLVVEQPWISEIDINPLIASSDRLLALDARVVLHGPAVTLDKLPKPAIRPYPLQYVWSWKMRDGNKVTIRPIRPEDEPLMVKFHETLSDRSVYLRYFSSLSLSRRIDHERLLRYFITKRSHWLTEDIVAIDRRGMIVYATNAALEVIKRRNQGLICDGRISSLNKVSSAAWPSCLNRLVPNVSTELVVDNYREIGAILILHRPRRRSVPTVTSEEMQAALAREREMFAQQRTIELGESERSTARMPGCTCRSARSG